MGATLAHFAIEADDVDRAKTFYETVLGWSFSPWGPPNFYHINGAGVHGALQERREPLPKGRKGLECTFAVSDLNETSGKLVTAGGSLTSEPFMIPEVGTLVGVSDTEGNEFILMQYTEAYAKMMGLSDHS